MNKMITNLQSRLTPDQIAKLDAAALKLAGMGAFAAYGVAGAQATTGNYSLDLTGSIGSFGSAMTSTVTTNAPALFGILALSVGFFFLWGRVRALF